MEQDSRLPLEWGLEGVPVSNSTSFYCNIIFARERRALHIAYNYNDWQRMVGSAYMTESK